MWVIKKINNNVAMGKDSRNREVVLFGKGIGFPQMPYELNDLSRIDRSYYGVSTSLLSLLDEIDEEIWNLTFRIVDRGKVVLNTNLKSSFTFVLADHLNFAVERIKKGLVISNPLQYDIEHLYEKEMELAEWAISLIDKKIRIKLPHAEAANIALHFAEAAEVASQMENKNDIEWVIEDVTKIVEESLGLKLDRKEFNYSRFVTHVQYLIQRKNRNSKICSMNIQLYEQMKEEFPKVYQVSMDIQKYFSERMGWNPDEEEVLYLMLHVNRLHSCQRLLKSQAPAILYNK